MDAQSAVDPQALDRLREWGGEKLLNQMVRLFLDNSKTRMDQIRTGVEGGDSEEAERGAHSLKSSAANVGGTEVRRIAADMEAAAVRGEADTLREMLPGLEEAYARVRLALESFAEGNQE